MIRRFTFFIAACSVLLVLNQSDIQAQSVISAGDVIQIDFGATEPTGTDSTYNFEEPTTTVPGTTFPFIPQTVFFDPLVYTALQTSTGVDTLTNLSLTGIGRAETGFAEATLNGTALDSSIFADSLGVNNGRDGTQLAFTFTGLDPNLVYDLAGGFRIESDPNDNANSVTPEQLIRYQQDWSIEGQGQAVTAATRLVAGDLFVDGYEEFTGLVADGGTLSFTISDATPPSADAFSRVSISALTLSARATAVPEPSSIAVLGIGVVGLIARRRRST